MKIREKKKQIDEQRRKALQELDDRIALKLKETLSEQRNARMAFAETVLIQEQRK